MSISGDLGRKAETAVADYLIGLGYRICFRNYRVARIGELDLVVMKNDVLTIVEVKARRNSRAFGGLPATISQKKINRIKKTAWCYLKEMQLMNNDVSILAALVNVENPNIIGSIEIIPLEGL